MKWLLTDSFIRKVLFNLVEYIEDGNVLVRVDDGLVVGEQVEDVHDGAGHPPTTLVVKLIKSRGASYKQYIMKIQRGEPI